MADSTDTTSTDSTATQTTPPDTSATDTLGDAGKKALDAERTRANDLDKQLKALGKEMDKLRTANLSDTEKALADAKSAGKTEAATEFGKRLAKAELKAAAAAKGLDLTGQLEYLDVARFVTAEGETDAKAISTFVEQFATTSTTTQAPSFDGGARTSSTGKSMNQIIREAAGRA